jgi:DNA-nicking Smr family endonuclease
MTKDSELFQKIIGQVKPIKYDRIISTPPKFKRSSMRKNNLEEDFVLEKDFSNAYTTPVEGETALSFTRVGVQEKQIKELRKGLLRSEAECDLHLLTQEQAEAVLERFLHSCVYEKNHRVVRIIHGKGNRSGQKGAVLKNLVNRRLREFQFILAFCSAPPKDGGTGAVIVLLKSMTK